MQFFTDTTDNTAIVQFQRHLNALTHIDACSAVEEIDENVSHAERSKGLYHYAYLSFGSKLNEQTVQHSIRPHSSNAPYQMIPQFLRIAPENQQILIVVVDTFSEVDSRNRNVEFLESMSKKYPHIDIILLDYTVSPSSVRSLIDVFIATVSKLRIPHTNTMIGNFIRFKHPNIYEDALESELPNAIQRSLNGGEYSQCFYQWYGYAYHTYDHMFCYKTYYHGYLAYMNTIQTLLRDTLGNTKLDECSQYNVRSYVDRRDRRIQSIWDQFIKNSVNIVDENICASRSFRIDLQRR